MKNKTEFKSKTIFQLSPLKRQPLQTDSLILGQAEYERQREKLRVLFLCFVNPNLFNGINMESISEFIIKNSEGENNRQSPVIMKIFTLLGSGKGIHYQITTIFPMTAGRFIYLCSKGKLFTLKRQPACFKTVFYLVRFKHLSFWAVIFVGCFHFTSLSPL